MLKPKAYAVIGANYGDEGKGAVTAMLCQSDTPTLVVKHNGGAQAGHTVVHDGKRFVFSQLGSGSVHGCDTYLASTFLINFELLGAEIKHFTEVFGKKPLVYVSRDCRVVTKYDMMANQLIEERRGAKRHGSCGHGINETVTRHKAGFTLTVADVLQCNGSELRFRLLAMRDNWYRKRLDNKEDFEKMAALDVDEVVKQLWACIYSYEIGWCLDPPMHPRIVFENGQGLALDEKKGSFPYVTRSRTGLDNPLRFMRLWGIDQIDAYYCTRPYVTRHGAGPLTDEYSPYRSNVFIPRFQDQTNFPNKWQGQLRFAPFTTQTLYRSIQDNYEDREQVNKKLVFTCLDQMDFMSIVIPNEDTTIDIAPDIESFLKAVETNSFFYGYDTKPIREIIDVRNGQFNHAVAVRDGVGATEF